MLLLSELDYKALEHSEDVDDDVVSVEKGVDCSVKVYKVLVLDNVDVVEVSVMAKPGGSTGTASCPYITLIPGLWKTTLRFSIGLHPLPTLHSNM